MHDLPVAVQLIPENVRHDDHFGTKKRKDLVQGALIAFNDGILFLRMSPPVRAGGKLCRHTGQEVGPGPVGDRIQSRQLHHPGQHGGGRRLPVGSGHNDAVHAF